MTLCRLLLALGGLRACPGAIDRIASSVEMAIAARSADGTGGGHRGGYRGAPGLTGIPGDAADFALTHSHAAACALAADLFVEQCVHPGADGGWRREALFPAECDPDADVCPGAGTRRPRTTPIPDATGDGILARANRRRRVAGGITTRRKSFTTRTIARRPVATTDRPRGEPNPPRCFASARSRRDRGRRRGAPWRACC